MKLTRRPPVEAYNLLAGSLGQSVRTKASARPTSFIHSSAGFVLVELVRCMLLLGDIEVGDERDVIARTVVGL